MIPGTSDVEAKKKEPINGHRRRSRDNEVIGKNQPIELNYGLLNQLFLEEGEIFEENKIEA